VPPSNPNIVLLHSHDTGRYISPYGYDVPTPNLHTLAEEALVFRNAFTPAPTCSPSRVAMMTGMVPHTAGMLGNTGHGWAMDDPDQHLANHLRKHGYDTVLCGFQDEQPGDNDPAKSRELGYRTFPDPNAADDDESTAAAATEYLASADEPFSLHTIFINTHRGYPDPEETGIDPDGVNPPGPLPDVPVCRRGWAGFHGSVRALDACAGMVIDALREHDMLGNTVLLFTTDHGPPFRDMKCTSTTGALVSHSSRGSQRDLVATRPTPSCHTRISYRPSASIWISASRRTSRVVPGCRRSPVGRSMVERWSTVK
jgi:N-sulfoglucosamine sulfohydrolase